MSNTAISIESIGAYYHTVPTIGGAAIMREGAPRKGRTAYEQNVGLYTFDRDAIRDEIGVHALWAASLTITREGSVTGILSGVTIAPAYGAATGSTLTHDEAISEGMRGLAYTVSVGDGENEIWLPGAMLRKLKNGECDGFLLYTGADEGGDTYARFGMTATLKLVVGSEWMTPVWTRPISSGDLVCHRDRSHISDLYELEYYINLRAAKDTQSPINIGQDEFDIGAYATWADIILYMQQAMEALYAFEHPEIEIDWVDVDPGDMPIAAAIIQLRNYLGSNPSAPTESITLDDWATAAHSYQASGFGRTQDTQVISWAHGHRYEPEPKNGKEWAPIMNPRWNSNWFVAWKFPDSVLAKMSGITHMDLIMRSGTTSDAGFNGQKNIVILPLIMNSVPDGNLAVGAVMDRSMIVGQGTGVPGTTVTIHMTDEFIAALKNGQTNEHPDEPKAWGIAIDCESSRKIWLEVTLVINPGGENE